MGPTSGGRGSTWANGRSFFLAASPGRSFVANLASTRKFRRRKNFGKKNWGRRDRFRQKIAEIEPILAIFEAFEVRKFCMPLFGEFSRSSQDL